ncbi:MAG: ATP-dependent Clp protease ATP-binding subunit [Clostridia bacterium]|nr:ATP-dependent Clp protease ATP-binding subunit [Clostridia bacterium]
MKSKFTQKAQNALNGAMQYARDMGSTYIGSEHLLLGLMGEGDSAASKLLYARGADTETIRNAAAGINGIRAASPVLPSDMTPRTKKIIEASAAVSVRYGQTFIGSEHLLLAMLEEKDCAAVKILDSVGVRSADIRSDITAYLDSISELASVRQKGRREAKSSGEIEGAPTLSRYGRDLTAAAASGALDPVIGRQTETERVIQILCRRTKNNPCLVGEPGVGKTAVVEGLAQAIAERNVPDLLENKRLISLDIPSMIAGAKYRGEFEERMKSVLEELRNNDDLVLFVDEVHTIIGAGAAEGAVDAANILKPALARSELQMIGATTLEEYRRHIEKDAALERRFQPVTVGEPSPEEAKEILRGLRDKYEAHHKLTITDEAIDAAVELSVRYVNDRFLPDKALDLIDETAAGIRISKHRIPEAQKRLEERLGEIAIEKEEAIAGQDFSRAADMRDEEIRLRSELESFINSNEKEEDPKEGLTLNREDIAATVTRWTGIPVSGLTADDGERYVGLSERLKRRVVGQNAAVDAVCRSILRGRAGLQPPDRPIGSFIFLGPGGVGKTELCRALAEELFGSRNLIIRLDMSEYMEKHSVSRLIGSPPGYVGYDEGGQLTEQVRRRPYSVVLFDEIEKAHPDIFNILLQVLEDGILTDSQGRRVDFKNTVIIMTSNAGSQYHTLRSGIGFSTADTHGDNEKTAAENEKRIRQALKETFRPEFLDRIDETVIFSGLSIESLRKICRRMLGELAKRASRSGVELNFDDSAVDFLCRHGTDSDTGARPLRHLIASRVEAPLSELILGGAVNSVINVRCDSAEKGIEFFCENKK